MRTLVTTPGKLLEILAINREQIQRNDRSAIEMLKLLNEDRAKIMDEHCLVSLELNNSMAQFYFQSGYKKAIENSLHIVDMYGHTPSVYIAWHLWLVGHCQACMGKTEAADNYLNQALEVAHEQEIPNPILLHEIFHSLAMSSHIGKAGVDITLPYLRQSLEAIIDLDEKVRKANCLTGMGNVYLDNELPEKALPNYLKAAGIYEMQNDEQNSAMVYSNLGLCYLGLKDYTNASNYLSKALVFQVTSGSPEHLGNTYHNLAVLGKEQKNASKAQYYLDKCKNIFTRTGNKPALEMCHDLQNHINELSETTVGLN
jgi:tetratricopeptide (TPR) repeat protein